MNIKLKCLRLAVDSIKAVEAPEYTLERAFRYESYVEKKSSDFDTNLEVDYLGLSRRTIVILRRNNVSKVYMLIRHTPEELLKFSNLGYKTLTDILLCLSDKNLSLPKDKT